MKKIFILLLSSFFFAACSQEEIIESSIDSNEPQPRAAADIFKLTEMVYPEEYTDFWYDGIRGVDNEGNFYYWYGEDILVKYDHQQNTVSYISSGINEGFIHSAFGYGHFCFDERNNVCFLIYNYRDRQYFLRRITPDGNSVYDQLLNFPEPVSEPWGEYLFLNTGICCAPNGNIFMLFGDYSYEIRCFRLASQSGALVELNIDDCWIGDMTPLYKSTGAILYSGCTKINTNTGAVETIQPRFELRGWQPTAACTSKANLYALNGRQIVMIRPNAVSDLIIGSIPNSYRNGEGQMVNVGEPQELYMNSDATIFYIRCKRYSESTGYTEDVFFKLTL